MLVVADKEPSLTSRVAFTAAMRFESSHNSYDSLSSKFSTKLYAEPYFAQMEDSQPRERLLDLYQRELTAKGHRGYDCWCDDKPFKILIQKMTRRKEKGNMEKRKQTRRGKGKRREKKEKLKKEKGKTRKKRK